MKNHIKEFVLNLGADLCGIANIERFSDAPEGFHPKGILPQCKSVIIFGIALPKGLTRIQKKMIYGHFYYCTYPELDLIAFKTSKELERLYHAVSIPIPSDGPYEYWDTEKLEGKGLISLKHAAMLAGLGTLGKNTLLLNKKHGNLLTLGAILTDLDLTSDPPAENICIEGCKLCIENCPVQALDSVRVNQAKCRPNTFVTNKRGFNVVNCNKCRVICPMKFGKENQDES